MLQSEGEAVDSYLDYIFLKHNIFIILKAWFRKIHRNLYIFFS